MIKIMPETDTLQQNFNKNWDVFVPPLLIWPIFSYVLNWCSAVKSII